MTATADTTPFGVAQTAGRVHHSELREARMRQLIVGFEYDPGENWKSKANCGGIDPNLFYLVDSEGVGATTANEENRKRHREARRYCEECPVVAQCLGYALTREAEGTWAGELFTTVDWYAGRRVRKELEGEWQPE